MKLPRKEKRKARIEMLPLLDIVFLLLVFFIYAMLSMSVHRAVPVNLPLSRSAEVEKFPPLALTVRADGSLFLNERPVILEDLAVTLQGAAKGLTDPTLQLFAEDRITYQRLFAVMDRIREAGIHRIALQAQKEPGP